MSVLVDSERAFLAEVRRIAEDVAGVAADEPAETLGEALSLPPSYEALRAKLEPALTQLPDIRQWRPPPSSK